jgi:hypothetical protein
LDLYVYFVLAVLAVAILAVTAFNADTAMDEDLDGLDGSVDPDRRPRRTALKSSKLITGGLLGLERRALNSSKVIGLGFMLLSTVCLCVRGGLCGSTL